MGILDIIRDIKKASDDLAKTEKEISNSTKNALDLRQKKHSCFDFQKWWDDENAKWQRNQCKVFKPYIFTSLVDYENAFGDTLNKFFLSHGNWREYKSYPEIHVDFLVVNALHFRETWNRRDINIKEILLNELRNSYICYADSKGFFLNNIYHSLIPRVWLVKGKLIMEFPTSDFPINYPRYCQKFIPLEYRQFIEQLNKSNEL